MAVSIVPQLFVDSNITHPLDPSNVVVASQRMQALLAVEVSGQGEPVVLIHGLATTRAIWSSVTPQLARSRRVVTLDVPGFGASAPAGPGFELEAVAERIADGLAARSIPQPFDLVGHSLGAGIALTLAVRRPRAVRRLVLVAPAGLTVLPQLPSRVIALGVDGLLAARRALAPLVDLAWGRRVLLAFSAADPSALSAMQARWMVEASAGAQRTSEALRTITTTDLRPLLARTSVPLGVIWGEEDRTVPVRTAAAIRALRPDADVRLIERAGHVAMVERPAVFAATLEGLLQGFPNTQQLAAGLPLG
jgi:pimeloyl-ACP methyl ester carboxylesterase